MFCVFINQEGRQGKPMIAIPHISISLSLTSGSSGNFRIGISDSEIPFARRQVSRPKRLIVLDFFYAALRRCLFRRLLVHVFEKTSPELVVTFSVAERRY